MADTPENQADYPQHGNQKKSCGFPILRLLAVMSLSMGTVVDYAVSAYKGKGTGEQSLLREIFSCIENDEIVLGNRYFPSFFLMADKTLGLMGFSVVRLSDTMTFALASAWGNRIILPAGKNQRNQGG